MAAEAASTFRRSGWLPFGRAPGGALRPRHPRSEMKRSKGAFPRPTGPRSGPHCV